MAILGLAWAFHPIANPATLNHTFPMLASLFGRCIGLSALVCVLLLFFFPLAHGNFQSTHGPVTALRSKHAFLMLVFSIARASLQVFAILVSTLMPSFGRLWRDCSHCTNILELPRSGSVLRC